MEKKGDLLNQLAIISDLIEKINLENHSSVLNNLQKKYGENIENVKDKFTLSLGAVDIIFSTNSA